MTIIDHMPRQSGNDQVMLQGRCKKKVLNWRPLGTENTNRKTFDGQITLTEPNVLNARISITEMRWKLEYKA